MPTAHLDDKFARSIERPPKGFIEYFDDKIPGFLAKVYADRIVGNLRYQPIGSTSRKRFWLGEHPLITMAAMRLEAEKARGAVLSGADPAGDREAIREVRKEAEAAAPELTFKELLELYEKAAPALKDSWEQDIGHIRRNGLDRWGQRAATAITPTDTARLMVEKSAVAKVSANRMRAAFTRMYKWAIEQGLLQSNPWEGTKKVKERSKAEENDKRALSDHELVVLLKAIEKARLAPGIKAALKVLAYTGQRPDEIGGLAISELRHVDDDALAHAEIPASRMKARRRHVWPISRPVAAIIREQLELRASEPLPVGEEPSGFIFASRFKERKRIARHSLSQALRRIIDSLKIEGPDAEAIRSLKNDPPTPHAFRRTWATGCARLRVPKEYRKAVMAHVDDDVMSQHYDSHDYFEEKKLALDKWAKHVEALLSGKEETGAVVPFKVRP